MQLAIPDPLRSRLAKSSHEQTVLGLVEGTGLILSDNQTPFFPAFTDHGLSHVEGVLDAAVKLVPEAAWELLEADDAATLIGAALLHDLAIHLRPEGFRQLVSPDTPFRPLLWFDQDQEGRPADVPWPRLWDAFRTEAQHFSRSEIDRILGPGQVSVPAVAYSDRLMPAEWTERDRLLIGEFLRRHHARLSHEVAHFGFPGTTAPTFPVLAQEDATFAEGVGVTARSHNERLRTMLRYLGYKHGRDLRPGGALLPYLMGLLRIADYLQLDVRRAPPLLLRLRNPQSQQSIDEWRKHHAVQRMSWDNEDDLAVKVAVDPAHGLRTHLQLRELLADLQRELDTTSAVLRETYSRSGPFRVLELTCQQVQTDLDEQAMHDQLPYVPRRARLRSAEDLFRLVISDLYGHQPVIAGRELLQNAVDAVRARQRWEALHGSAATPSVDTGDADVLVQVAEIAPREWELRIADRGIGMTPEIVIDYFLTAGASYGPSKEDYEGLERDEAISWMRAGRFGVGAFATFLLGTELHVSTRHVAAERGVSFTAHLDEELVELRWADVPVGTEIRIPFDPSNLVSDDLLRALMEPDDLLLGIATYYALQRPRVRYESVRLGAQPVKHSFPRDVPDPRRPLSAAWRSVDVPGFDDVIWKAHTREARDLARPELVHNGLAIREPLQRLMLRNPVFQWTNNALDVLLETPLVAVFDSRHNLGLSLTRYRLVDKSLPFERALLTSIGKDVIAHALQAGPAGLHPMARGFGLMPIYTIDAWHPLLPGLDRRGDSPLCVLWDPFYQAGASEHAPDAGTSFLGPLRSATWDRLPFRAMLPMREGYDDPSPYEEAESWEYAIDRWGFDLSSVDASIRWLAQPLGRDPLATVVHRAGEIPLPIHHKPASEDAQELLFAVAEEVAPTIDSEGFAITLFERPNDPARTEDPLSAVWMETFDNHVPREPGALRAARETAIRRHPELGALIDIWQTSLA